MTAYIEEQHPTRYLRVNITKTATKGYTYETTASCEGVTSTHDVAGIVAELLREGDAIARDEIARRESLDPVTS